MSYGYNEDEGFFWVKHPFEDEARTVQIRDAIEGRFEDVGYALRDAFIAELRRAGYVVSTPSKVRELYELFDQRMAELEGVV